MFALYPSNFYNVWLDVKPAKGHRVLMQSFPGGVHSGMDYYLNDAGLLISETTISQTQFDVKGAPLASRIRQAIQYADSIDKAVAILKQDNNGLYTNEWLLGDVKTNEVAMFELGTHKTRLWRSGKDEWFGDTPGFYWGCNNTKDLEVRLETLPGTAGRPGNAVFSPSIRDRKWLQLYDRYKGKMDADFGKLAFTTPPLAAFSSVDAKFTTTDMAKRLKSWALFGPPLGRTWEPTFDERTKFPEVRPLVRHPWTILGATPPERTEADVRIADLHDPQGKRRSQEEKAADPPTTPAWHGTLLPASAGDTWLAAGFTAYERFVALERALKRRHADDQSPADADRLAVALHGFRAMYESAARKDGDVPLLKVRRDLRSDGWHRLALGKGVLLLHGLREQVGDEAFVALMDDFGTANAGKTVRTAQFAEHVEKAAGKKARDWLQDWLQKPGLPKSAGGPFSVLTFYPEVEETLIVCGTADEEEANAEAAVALQKALLRRGHNVLVPIRKDTEVTAEELKSHHLLLVGRPATNGVTSLLKELPAAFGPASVAVRDEVYAHPDTAVLLAAENPHNRRYSAVVVAGLGAASTLSAAQKFAERQGPDGEVVILRPGRRPHGLVVTDRLRGK